MVADTRTPLLPGEVADCAGGCGRKVAGEKTARMKKGVFAHKRGKCARCVGGKNEADRERRKGYVRFGLDLEKPLDREWRGRAACAGADPNLFEERPLSGPIKRVPEEILSTALQYCAGCPVLAECKAEADANPAMTGLLGGVFRTLNLRSSTLGAYRSFDLLDPAYLEGI